jgi:hypothetical protein
MSSLLAVVVLLLLAPVAQADTLLYVDRLAVVDGTGRQVGTAWPSAEGRPDYMYVEFRVGSTPVIVLVGPDRFEPNALRFSDPGCTGQALLTAPWGEGSTPFTAVAGPRSTVYVQSGPVRERTARSTLSSTGVCRDSAPLRSDMAPLRAVTDLADHFVPPFTLQERARTPVPRGEW